MSAHPCGECSSCREIASGTSVDVIEIDGASNTSVNDIRAIKEEVLFPPQSSRYKIYIIDEVHMLSTSAFNALLKTIEEPPEYIIFIFATTELQKVPATIRSRCQQFRFQLISQELIQSCLKSAADDLSIEADEDALFWIAKEATGSMRDAYTLFDQVAAFSGNHITLQKIRERLNLAGFSKISEIASLSVFGSPEKAIELLSSLFEAGVSPEQIVKDSADFFRTVLLYKTGIRRPSLLGVSEDDIPKELVDALSKEQIEAALKAEMDLYRDMRYSISPRFEVELMVSRLSSLSSLVSGESLIQEIKKMREGIAEGKVIVKKKVEKIVAKEEVTTPITTKEIQETKEDIKPLESNSEPKPVEKAIVISPEPICDTQKATVDISLIPLIQDELRYMGKSVESRYISAATAIENNGDNTILITMGQAFQYNSLLPSVPHLSKAVGKIIGRNVSVRLELSVQKNTERKASLKMEALKSIFGGNIEFREIASITKETEQTPEKEEKTNDEQSLRVYEADGDAGSSDEDD